MHFCQFICFWIGGGKLKGHGNEADFLGVLQKSVPLESLTQPFEPFRILLRIRGDIGNRKTTLRLAELGSRRLPDSASRRLTDLQSRQVPDSASRRVG
jgi:hypothetical protein